MTSEKASTGAARGFVCAKHGEYCPTGECRWCEPARPTTAEAALSFMGVPVIVDRADTQVPATLETADGLVQDDPSLALAPEGLVSAGLRRGKDGAVFPLLALADALENADVSPPPGFAMTREAEEEK